MIDLEAVQKAVSKDGYKVSAPTPKIQNILANDLDEADKYELGRTWRENWKEELLATFANTTRCYVVSSGNHRGFAVFGLTQVQSSAAQMWLLQTKTFAKETNRFHGAGWPFRASRMSQRVVSLALEHYCTVFNFIPRSQVRIIRWLKKSGFTFYAHPTKKTDMLLFAAGRQGKHLSKDKKFWDSFVGHNGS